MTAFYSGRLLFMTFHGKSRADEDVLHHAHESPKSMLIPLYVLATGAVLAGFVFYEYFVGHHYEAFWGEALSHTTSIIEDAHHVPTWVKVLPLIMGLSGLALSWVFYIWKPSIPGSIAKTHEPLYKFLLNKWYFDELYDFLFVRPASKIGRFFWKQGDGKTIDGYGPDGVSALVAAIAGRARRMQTGYVYHYAFAMLIGVAALLTWYIVRAGGAG